MTNRSPIRSICQPPARRASEQGYVMLAVIFFLALLVLSLSIAAPKVAKSIQRDREVETFHRGMQYRRAIQLYYRKFNAYPPNLDALVNTNNIRFLRKKYIDPMTGKADWKPVLFGQNKTPTAMGFFGQPLAGGATTVAGIGPSGGPGMPGSQNSPGGFGGSSFGGSSFGGSSFGGSSFGSGSYNSGPSGSNNASSTGSDPGSQNPSPGGSSDSGSSPGNTDSSNGSSGGSQSSGNPSSPGSSSGPGPSTGSGTNPNGQTFGGAGIIGFSVPVDKKSILVYKKKQKYIEWEFTWDPISEMRTIAGGNAGAIGQPAGSGGIGGGLGTGIGGGLGTGTGGGLGSTGGGIGSGTGSGMGPTGSGMGGTGGGSGSGSSGGSSSTNQ